jgi:hypothetical protein
LATYPFGGVAEYDKGLQAVGTPHPNILEHMEKEATKSSNSNDIFRAWISGPSSIVSNKTFPAKEWDFVVEPYEKESISRDKPPSEWKPKHEYGGKRIPIRLEVFLHALSAMQMASRILFGDYNEMHQITGCSWAPVYIAHGNFEIKCWK